MSSIVVMAIPSPTCGIGAGTAPTRLVVNVSVVERPGIILMTVTVRWVAATTGTRTSSVEVFSVGVFDFRGR